MRERGATDLPPQRVCKLGAFLFAKSRQQRGELLAAEAIRTADWSHRFPQRLPDMLHDQIPSIVPELIVEALEVVDIDHQASELFAGVFPDMLLQCVIQETPLNRPVRGSRTASSINFSRS